MGTSRLGLFQTNTRLDSKNLKQLESDSSPVDFVSFRVKQRNSRLDLARLAQSRILESARLMPITKPASYHPRFFLCLRSYFGLFIRLGLFINSTTLLLLLYDDTTISRMDG